MDPEERSAPTLVDARPHVRLELAGLWTVLMLTYIYVDIIGFYKPGFLREVLRGHVWEFEITQAWGVTALVLMLVPASMVYLSLKLPARVSRWANIAVGATYILVGIGTSVGETWTAYLVGHVIGILTLALIVRTATQWPVAAASTPMSNPAPNPNPRRV